MAALTHFWYINNFRAIIVGTTTINIHDHAISDEDFYELSMLHLSVDIQEYAMVLYAVGIKAWYKPFVGDLVCGTHRKRFYSFELPSLRSNLMTKLLTIHINKYLIILKYKYEYMTVL